MKNLISLTTASLALFLTACGGGGGDSATAGSDTPFTSTPPSATAGADKYVGTWDSSCTDSPVTTNTTPPVTLKQKLTYEFTKTGDNALSYVLITNIYTSVDCSGAAAATNTNRSGTNALVIDGSTTVGGAAADKVTFTRGNIGGLSAGTVVILNGLVYPGDYFVKTSVDKDLAQFNGSSVLFLGNTTPVDAQGYPSTVNAALTYTKR